MTHSELEAARKKISFLEQEVAYLRKEIAGFNLTLFQTFPKLSPTERRILELLYKASPTVVSHERLSALCRENTLYSENSIRQLICNIRRKLKISTSSQWGIGYFLSTEEKEKIDKMLKQYAIPAKR